MFVLEYIVLTHVKKTWDWCHSLWNLDFVGKNCNKCRSQFRFTCNCAYRRWLFWIL